MKKGDELLPPRRGRSWTRAEDYLPPRRSRSAPGRKLTARPSHVEDEDHGQGRPLLGLVPFGLLMLGLAVLAVAIAVAAWPDRQTAPAPQPQPEREAGTAPPGWLDRR